MEEIGDQANRKPHPSSISVTMSEMLERAEAGDDALRLRTLEDVLLTLGSELEGDPDQAGATRP